MTVQVQLLGRGTYSQEIITGPGISPLWQFFLPPSGQNSIIIYDDGSVLERRTFETEDIAAADVHTYILGGTDYRTNVGTFEYESLTAAGYSWRNVYSGDVYAEDYDSPYN